MDFALLDFGLTWDPWPLSSSWFFPLGTGISVQCLFHYSILEAHNPCPWRRQWDPTPVLLPGKSHGRRSLVGYSPWGREELDVTERLHFHFSLSCIGEGNGNPFQCSCLENPRDGGAWWAAIYGVAQSWTQLKRLSSSSNPCPVSYLEGNFTSRGIIPESYPYLIQTIFRWDFGLRVDADMGWSGAVGMGDVFACKEDMNCGEPEGRELQAELCPLSIHMFES